MGDATDLSEILSPPFDQDAPVGVPLPGHHRLCRSDTEHAPGLFVGVATGNPAWRKSPGGDAQVWLYCDGVPAASCTSPTEPT